MFKPTTITRGKTKGCWSVALHHEESGKVYWVDLSLDERWHEIDADWNQYIFYLSDPDDMVRKDFQEDTDNADEAFSEAVSVLEREGEAFLGEDGDWYIKGEWKGEQTWTI